MLSVLSVTIACIMETFDTLLQSRHGGAVCSCIYSVEAYILQLWLNPCVCDTLGCVSTIMFVTISSLRRVNNTPVQLAEFANTCHMHALMRVFNALKPAGSKLVMYSYML